MYRIFLVIILFVAVACSGPKRIQKSLIGKNISEVPPEWGKAKTVFEKNNEKVYVFEKIKYLKGTEIGQHKVTLDPIVSPKVKKTERYLVSVKDGKIAGVEVENDYQR